tara:strand:- start:2299 stop:2832 length:534 start_codon:yes stop_codon:yes gene_type:complete
MATVATRVDAKRAIRKLRILEKAMGEDIVLELIGRGMLKAAQLNFESDGAIFSPKGSWEPLSPNSRIGNSKPMLVDTGALKNAFSYTTGGGEVEIRNIDPKASIHHFGTKLRTIVPSSARVLKFQTVNRTVFTKKVIRHKIPARRLLPTKAIARKLVTQIIRKHMDTTVARLTGLSF